MRWQYTNWPWTGCIFPLIILWYRFGQTRTTAFAHISLKFVLSGKFSRNVSFFHRTFVTNGGSVTSNWPPPCLEFLWGIIHWNFKNGSYRKLTLPKISFYWPSSLNISTSWLYPVISSFECSVASCTTKISGPLFPWNRISVCAISSSWDHSWYAIIQCTHRTIVPAERTSCFVWIHNHISGSNWNAGESYSRPNMRCMPVDVASSILLMGWRRSRWRVYRLRCHLSEGSFHW